MTPVLYCDFDGVLNALSTEDVWGDQQAGELKSNHSYKTWPIRWSPTLISNLASLKETHPFEWVWLTTWTKDTHRLDELLETPSDRDLTWETQVLNRDLGKLTVLLHDQAVNPRPFVWVDDTATVNPARYPEIMTQRVEAPYLIVTPDASTGVSPEDFQRISWFMKKYAA